MHQGDSATIRTMSALITGLQHQYKQPSPQTPKPTTIYASATSFLLTQQHSTTATIQSVLSSTARLQQLRLIQTSVDHAAKSQERLVDGEPGRTCGTYECCASDEGSAPYHTQTSYALRHWPDCPILSGYCCGLLVQVTPTEDLHGTKGRCGQPLLTRLLHTAVRVCCFTCAAAGY